MRVIALTVLLLAAGATTRGYLPGAQRGPRRAESGGAVEAIILAGLLAVSGAVVVLAIVHRTRHRRSQPGGAGPVPLAFLGGRVPVRRAVLLVVAALALWLLTLVVLAKFGAGHHLGIPVEVAGAGDAASSSPSDPPPAPRPASGGPPGGRSAYLLALLTLVPALVAAAVVATRNRPPAPPPSTVLAAVGGNASTGETLVRAAELGLARIIDPSREPRAAIIACYTEMERHLGADPDIAPRAFDTPTEVLARAVDHHALAPDNAARLVGLFAEARFSAHQMTEQHRADAVDALRMVLEELRRPR
ncbi:hypothetical protein MHIB_14500 [Mycolicibacter hiberniae]|uniref:Protein-glutamine gamma-glutamyltransferase-like C-terminal domain-containing protein n=1 Tax=Mycolicibacter hiberniae TaxID=29314 RepID=A0A7I7X0T1_9MYCO|nr:hypothetical protein MHIB_14500 [Mycolicibacter hiberniae]